MGPNHSIRKAWLRGCEAFLRGGFSARHRLQKNGLKETEELIFCKWSLQTTRKMGCRPPKGRPPAMKFPQMEKAMKKTKDFTKNEDLAISGT